MSQWIQGAPSAEQVRRHDAAHAIGPKQGAQWICKDPEGSGVYLVRLTVICDTVHIANGFAFWQPLEKTLWAYRARYRPVDADGYEVTL